MFPEPSKQSLQMDWAWLKTADRPTRFVWPTLKHAHIHVFNGFSVGLEFVVGRVNHASGLGKAASRTGTLDPDFADFAYPSRDIQRTILSYGTQILFRECRD